MLLGVLIAIGGMISIAGIDLLVKHASPTEIAAGAALVLVGLIPSPSCIWRLWRRLVQLRRIHIGLCAHCKYEILGTRKGRCPECGEDPFEPA